MTLAQLRSLNGRRREQQDAKYCVFAPDYRKPLRDQYAQSDTTIFGLGTARVGARNQEG